MWSVNWNGGCSVCRWWWRERHRRRRRRRWLWSNDKLKHAHTHASIEHERTRAHKHANTQIQANDPIVRGFPAQFQLCVRHHSNGNKVVKIIKYNFITHSTHSTHSSHTAHTQDGNVYRKIEWPKWCGWCCTSVPIEPIMANTRKHPLFCGVGIRQWGIFPLLPFSPIFIDLEFLL